MDANQVENLLQAVEGSNLDFKSEVDLDSKRGKADFLVEVLGLANAVNKPAYLVLGVQDKPREIIGLPETINEERISKLIADNCRPILRSTFHAIPYKRKRIGIFSIDGMDRPYALKKDLAFEDDRGKQHTYTDKQVFVRRGSTGDTATLDEVTEMALEKHSSNQSAMNVDGLEEELYRISSRLHYLNEGLRSIRDRSDRERAVEYLFIGIFSGLLVGVAQALVLDWQLYILGIFLSTFWISIFASVLKLVRFGWIRSVLISLAISTIFVLLSVLLDTYANEALIYLGFPMNLYPIWSGMKGMAGGAVAAYLGRGEYEYE